MNKTLKEKILKVNDEYLEFVKINTPNIYQNMNSKIDDEVLLLLKDEKPRIMVYGIYNAGKSTLVNCLLREEKAAMADRPMTDAIDLYETDTYTLIDSPGVDAPIEHEKVTNEFLSKCHAILFVMSSKGGFESRENYTRLIELMNKGLPFIIVLNERGIAVPKNASESDKQVIKLQQLKDLDGVKDKIMKNVVEIGGDKSIAKRYQVIDVNAKKALAGLKTGKEELFKQGKIINLENKINQVISVEIDKLLIQPIENLKSCITMCETELISQNSTVDNKNYAQLVNIINAKINNLRGECALIIDNLLNKYSVSINEAFKNKDQEKLQNIIADIESGYTTDTQSKLYICNDYIQKNCDDVYKNLICGNIETSTDVQFDINDVSDKERIYADYNDEDFSVAQEAVKAVGAGAATTLGASTAIAAVSSSFLLPLISIPAGIVAGFATWNQANKKREEQAQRNIDAQNQAEEMRVAQEMRIEQEANVATSSFMFEIKNSLSNSFELYINDYQYSIMNKIKEIELKEQENAEETKIKIIDLKKFTDELNKIKQSI